MIITDNGGVMANSFSTDIEARDLFASKMNVVKKCSNALSEGCWTGTLVGPEGFVTNAGMILSDGTMVAFNFSSGNYSSSCNIIHGNATNVCFEIYVDTNGFKRPNKTGKDVLVFLVYENTLRIGGTNNDYYAINPTYYACSTGIKPFLCQFDYFK